MKKFKKIISILTICALLVSLSPIGIVSASAENTGYWKLVETRALYDPDDGIDANYVEIPWGSGIDRGSNITDTWTGEEGDIHLVQTWSDGSVHKEHYTWTPPQSIIYPNTDFKVSYECAVGGDSYSNGGIYYRWDNYSYHSAKNFNDKLSAGYEGYEKVDLPYLIGGRVLYDYVYKWTKADTEIPTQTTVTPTPEIKATMTAIKVIPANISISRNTPKQLKVVASMSDGKEKDITNDENTEYDVDDSDVATVSLKGLVSVAKNAQNGETATIEVNNGELSATCIVKASLINVKIVKSTLTNIVLSSKANQNTKQLKIIAVLSDNKQVNATGIATYTSSNLKCFTVSATGVLKVAVGTPKGTKGYIDVKYEGKTCRITIKVK